MHFLVFCFCFVLLFEVDYKGGCFILGAFNRTMALKKILISWVSISLLVLFLVQMPFVQSSRPSFQGGMVAVDSVMATKELEANLVKHRFERAGGSALSSLQDSARQVPTGADPLHHNDNPAGP